MRLRLIGSFLLSYFILIAVAHAALPTPIVKIDADQLALGPIGPAGVPNTGSLGGTFNSIASPAPVVKRMGNRMAIAFTGKNGLQSSFVAPMSILNQNPFSFATWIYNPEIASEERFLSWTWKPAGYSDQNGEGGNTRMAAFGYGYAYAWGFAPLGGGAGDVSWGRLPVPKAGVWHHLAATFAGTPGAFIVYVDGKPVSAEVNKWLAFGYFHTAPTGVTVPGTFQVPIRIGCSYNGLSGADFNAISGLVGNLSFNGGIASLYMYDSELSPSDIMALAGAKEATGDYLFDPSFEFNHHGQGWPAVIASIFNKDGSPTGATTGWTSGGWVSYNGAWNSAENGRDSGWGGVDNFFNTGISHYTIPQAGRKGGPGAEFDKFNSTRPHLVPVDGLSFICLEAGNNYTYNTPNAPYQAFPRINGLHDAAYFTQPIWGLKPGHKYTTWGFFSPTDNNGEGRYAYSSVVVKLDNTNIIDKEKVFYRKPEVDIANVTTFKKVSAEFTVPAEGYKTFSVGNEGHAGRNSGNITSGSETFSQRTFFLCSKVGVAEVNSPPVINVMYNPAPNTNAKGPISFYGEKQLFFGPVSNGSQKIVDFTISNEGGSPMEITDITFSGGGSDQFVMTMDSTPTPAAPFLVDAYGGMKKVSAVFAPTRSGVYSVNVLIQAKYLDMSNQEDPQERVMVPFQFPCFGYSRQMIWNNSFEFPHNIYGEGNNIVYDCPSLGWTFTRLRTGTSQDCHFGVAPMGTWATWGSTGSGVPGMYGEVYGLPLKDGTQLGFLRQAGKITQLVPGFQAGRNYRLVVWAAPLRENYGFPVMSIAMRHPTDVTKDVELLAPTTLNNWAVGKRWDPWVDWSHNVLQRFDMTFSPTVASAYTLEIKNNQNTTSGVNQIFGVDLVKLYQVGSAAVAYTPTKTLWFGDCQKNDLTTSMPLTIYNDGGSTLTVNGITFTGANASEFDLLDNQGNPINPAFKIPPFYMSTTTLVRIKGTSEGFKCGTLAISTGNQYVSTGVISVDLGGNIPLAPVVVNGSFEVKVPDGRDLSRFGMYDPDPLGNGANQGYVNNGTTINNPLGWKGYMGWDRSGVSVTEAGWVGAGVSHTDVFMPSIRTGGNWDNGLADGSYCYQIRKTAAEPAKSVWQKVPGFRAGSGRRYHISAKINSPRNKTATAFINLDGVEMTTGTTTPVDSYFSYVNPFQTIGFDYTPTVDSAHVLEVGIKGGDGDLLIDDVKVEEINSKIAVDQTSIRFPDLVVQKPDGANYDWFYQPTKAYLQISNVGYGNGLVFSTNAADSNTSFAGLKFTGNGAFKINAVRNSAGVVITSLSSLAVGDSIEVELVFDPPHDTANLLAYHTLGNLAGALVITTNDPNYPRVTVTLNANKVPVEMGSFNVD